MSFNYCVSAQKPTCVTQAIVGNFTGQDDLNLVLAKVVSFLSSLKWSIFCFLYQKYETCSFFALKSGGNFILLPEDRLNFCFLQVNRLELFLVGVGGLRPLQEVPVHGRVVVARFFRPKNAVNFFNFTFFRV